MKEKFKSFINSWVRYILNIVYVFIILVVTFFIIKILVNVQIPSWSWWSATLLSDNKTNSIITEVESSGYNIRKVQSIDIFGRVCTDTYSVDGTTSDCDYPPIERSYWTIEDYRKKLKD